MADWYAAKLAAGSPIHEWALVVLLAETGAPQDEPVLDLGCGEGLVARSLAERGAEVTGVDGSERMLANARRQETAQPLGIDYRQLDARVLDGLPGERFAGVTANLSLNDIPDLDAVLTAVHRVLRPGGWFGLQPPASLLRDAARLVGRHVRRRARTAGQRLLRRAVLAFLRP